MEHTVHVYCLQFQITWISISKQISGIDHTYCILLSKECSIGNGSPLYDRNVQGMDHLFMIVMGIGMDHLSMITPIS